MKKGLFFITLCLCITTLLAQKLSDDFDVSVSKPYQVIDAGSKEYISCDDGFVIMAKMGKGQVNIQRFDVTKMQEVSRKTYDDLPDGSVFQEIIKLGKRIFYIYEAEDKKLKKHNVYAREINTEDGTFLKQSLLFTSGRKAVGLPKNGDLRQAKVGVGAFQILGNKFLIYKSFDNTKVLINYRLAPAEKDDAKNFDEIGFYVFDEGMQKLWGAEVKMPYTEAQINNIGYSVTSNGEAIMLAANREEKKYELFSVDKSGKLSVKKLDLSTDQMLKNVSIKEDANGDIVFGGFYANGIEYKFDMGGGTTVFNANGLLYIKLDKGGEILVNKTHDFSEDFIKQNLNERLKQNVEEREAKGKAGIFDLYLNELVVKEDGSSYFVGERQWVRNEFWGPKQQAVYHFGNVIIVKINKNGELEWMKKLPKNQAGVAGCGQMSIAFMEGKNADYIAYVDNPKNIDLSAEDGIPEAHKDGVGGFLTTYKVDHATGKSEKHTICELKDIKGTEAFQFTTWRIMKAQEGIFLTEVYAKGKQDCMVKFELK